MSISFFGLLCVLLVTCEIQETTSTAFNYRLWYNARKGLAQIAQCDCDDVFLPTCGKDGLVYPSSCIMLCSGVFPTNVQTDDEFICKRIATAEMFKAFQSTNSKAHYYSGNPFGASPAPLLSGRWRLIPGRPRRPPLRPEIKAYYACLKKNECFKKPMEQGIFDPRCPYLLWNTCVLICRQAHIHDDECFPK